MKRLIPSSLLGQVMLVLAIGLLMAQVISAVLLYRASEDRRETAIVSSMAFRLIAEGSRSAERAERRARLESLRREAIERGEDPRPGGGRPFARRMRLGVERSETSPIAENEPRLASLEQGLRDVLSAQDLVVGDIAVTRRLAGNDPYVQDLIERRPRMRTPGWEERQILVASVERTDQPGWLTVRIPEPRRPPGGLAMLVLQTLVTFVVLVLLLYLVLRRITRPLALLTERLSDFSRRPDQAVRIAESGPADTRRLIAAHNAMESRIAALLDEKDVMLGAIGHDLKTPLAALRVRIESVPDEVQRERMAESIEDITATLDDILTLARIGRSHGDEEPVDLGALALGVVEEFEDLDQPVTIDDPPRLPATVHVTWLKRALRNLVGNAVRYGGTAEVTVERNGDEALIVVADRGPGIPADRIADMFEPFTRGEASRNRATGGAGLGLTLARAIAEQHGGSLTLQNREGGGLRAELRLPL
ncbi:HAMP domain-containing sensor histidine kinase [Erythrobacter sp. THAF29]|uniref:sensor histidine kinase n=1 Tax=Erythrobacter sp. THAF29 TaxID=2587851 RepID=UPI0012696DC2|nr:ATP-binding protein [Erythrobacter sp. THAF29]QFT76583.1 Sensor protein RstB [Erythrobacter sp. THAF29]